MGNKKPLIIGFDPGTTAAIAGLNPKNGEISLLTSSKNMDQQEVIGEIISNGKPVLVATDKSKTPSKVSKIAKSLGISIYKPNEDLSSEIKKKTGEGNNSHEKDASAASKIAYKNNKQQIEKVKKISDNKDQVLSKLLKNYFNGKNIKNKENKPKKNTKNNKEKEKKSKSSKEKQITREKYKRLQRNISNLENQVKKLKRENEELKQDKQKLKGKNSQLKNERKEEIFEQREYRKLKSRIRDKEDKIDNLKRKLKQRKIREKTYQKAMQKIRDEEAEILQKINSLEQFEKGSKAITEIRELAENNRDILYKKDAKGIELPNYYVLTGEKHSFNFKKMIKNYKKKRNGETQN